MPSPSSSNISLVAPPSPPFIPSSAPLASTSHLQLPPTPPSDIQTNNPIEQAISSIQSLEVDPQIIEALKNKDRIYVLKLGELMEGLINDRRLVLFSIPTFRPFDLTCAMVVGHVST